MTPPTILYAVFNEKGLLKIRKNVYGEKQPAIFLTKTEAELEQAAFQGEKIGAVRLVEAVPAMTHNPTYAEE